MANTRIEKKVYENFQQMSAVTGLPISSLINRALDDWFSTVGAVQMEAVQDAVTSGRAVLNNAMIEAQRLRERSAQLRAEAEEVAALVDQTIEESKQILARAAAATS
jgi:hypothetical protein